jgi:hypothetical protein
MLQSLGPHPVRERSILFQLFFRLKNEQVISHSAFKLPVMEGKRKSGSLAVGKSGNKYELSVLGVVWSRQ